MWKYHPELTAAEQKAVIRMLPKGHYHQELHFLPNFDQYKSLIEWIVLLEPFQSSQDFSRSNILSEWYM